MEWVDSLRCCRYRAKWTSLTGNTVTSTQCSTHAFHRSKGIAIFGHCIICPTAQHYGRQQFFQLVKLRILKACQLLPDSSSRGFCTNHTRTGKNALMCYTSLLLTPLPTPPRPGVIQWLLLLHHPYHTQPAICPLQSCYHHTCWLPCFDKREQYSSHAPTSSHPSHGPTAWVSRKSMTQPPHRPGIWLPLDQECGHHTSQGHGHHMGQGHGHHTGQG